jgi:hypothetical protein
LTIGIAVCFEDAVLLIADGKVTQPYVNNRVITNDDDKITVFNQQLACIQFGITVTTSYAVNIISQNLREFETIDEVMQVITKAVTESWSLLQMAVSKSVDKTNPAFKEAIVVAGYVSNPAKFFIGGVLQTLDSKPQQVVATMPNNFILLSHDDPKAKAIFKKYVSETELQAIRHITPDIRFNEYLDAAAKTIRDIEKIDLTIGGIVRYVILTKDSKPICGQIP